MNYKENIFNVIKLLAIMIIFVELATVKMIIAPQNFKEYIHILASVKMYIEHIVLSIVFLSLGALIYLKEAWFFVHFTQEYFFRQWIKPLVLHKFCQVESGKFIIFYGLIFGKCVISKIFFNFSTGRRCGKVEISTWSTLQNHEFCTFSTEFSTLHPAKSTF